MPQKPKIAYTMSRFPKLTETFILYEILALEKMGVQVELYPLIREHQSVVHPEAAKMIPRGHFHPLLSLEMIPAHLHFMVRKPRAYFGTLLEVLQATAGSFNFLMGAIGIWPKSILMARKMARQRITHLHAHFANHPAAAAFIIKRLTDIPYSFTAHGSDLHVERRMLDKKVQESAFTVTISEFNKQVILDECGGRFRDKVKVVHCGVDPEEFKPDLGGKKERPFQIVCIASFEEVKGHKYLVEACRLLEDQGLDFKCHFVGYGPLKNEITKLVSRLGLGNRIEIHPPLARPDIIKIYARSHVKVLPSVPTKQGKREGIPVVLMEAMAMGLPCVSSRLSGIPELVADRSTGLLTEPRDVTALADALVRLYQDPKLRLKMGKAGRKRVMDEYNLPKNAETLSKLFLSNLSQSPSQAPEAAVEFGASAEL